MAVIQTWLKIDVLISVILGTFMVVFPKQFLPFIIVDKIDGIHAHMARVGGCVLLGQSVTYWRWSKLTVNYVGTAALMSRLMGCILCFGATVHSRTFHMDHFNLPPMKMWTTFLLITFLIGACLLLGTKWPIGEFLHESKKQRIFNSLIQLDSVLAVSIGILFAAYPDRILYGQTAFEPNASHYFLCRIFGSLLYATSVLSNHALYFAKSEEREAWGTGRSLICLLVLSSQIYSQFAYPQSWSGKHWVGASLFSIWAIVCFFVSFLEYRGVFR